MNSPIVNRIIEELEADLRKVGVYYRIFGRLKDPESIRKKLEKKKDKYIQSQSKMQDIVGIRIVFYFLEDVNIFYNYLVKSKKFLSESNSQKDIKKEENNLSSIENLADKIFMPTRLNLVFRMDDKETKILQNELYQLEEDERSLIDSTYEIQLRTVLSEGWHEIEHDLRYKTKDESWWRDCTEESRMLNGLYATLETSERAMEHVFSSISYKNYKKKQWEVMMRNHFKLKFESQKLSPKYKKILQTEPEIAKALFKQQREDILMCILNYPLRFPLSIDNIVLLTNRLSIHNEELAAFENDEIKKTLDKMVKKKKNN